MKNNIIIIDDSNIERKIIAQALKSRLKDINVIEADNGIDVKEKIIKYEIKLCILDIWMPIKDGFEILEEIKCDSKLKDIPVIVCTAFSDKEALEKALSLGAYDYFTKPLSSEAIKISLPIKVKNAIDLFRRKEELKEQNKKIYKLAYSNYITGLPNRRMLKEKIQELLQNRDLSRFALIYIDLDNFKDINDSFGHITGDKILHAVGMRLKYTEDENIIAFNLGGDEFIILIKKLSDTIQIEDIVEKVLNKVNNTISIDNNTFNITASA